MNYTEGSHVRPIRVLLAEDYEPLRHGIRTMLARFPMRVQIIGEARNIEETLRMAIDRTPDIILLDLQMPPRPGVFPQLSWEEGISAIKQLEEQAPQARILVLSNHKQSVAILAAIQAGADGYIAKSDEFEGERLVDAFQKVCDGTLLYGPAIVQTLKQFEHVERLTPREHEVLLLLLQNRSNRDIAESLTISLPTVKTHVRSILGKLGITSRDVLPYLAEHARRRDW